MIVSQEDLRAIIVEGNVEKLVAQAKRLGDKLKVDGLSTAQIRGVFGTARQIEQRWRESGLAQDGADAAGQAAWRQLVLLKPKLEYQARRHASVAELRDTLNSAITLVDQDRQRFSHLMEFFEAVLAYHVAAGGKTS